MRLNAKLEAALLDNKVLILENKILSARIRQLELTLEHIRLNEFILSSNAELEKLTKGETK